MNLMQRLRSGAAKAADKAQRTVETTKLSAMLARKRKELNQNFTWIGSAVYEAYKLGNLSIAETEISRLSEENKKIEEAIEALRMRIVQVNDQRLCLCGKVVPSEAAFCQSCGRKLEPIEAEAAAASASAKDESVLDVEFEAFDDVASVDEKDPPTYEGTDAERCIVCGDELGDNHAVCRRCGTAQVTPNAEER
ncbi:double zinc ribbon domain-containing protein [Paenibacillus koleovorans]|uniref:double zinc ribbon domain-containing protein n=1 Tax=Paenibacillus koleovorans TaxID=121608 RepID=UPI0013E3EA2A|nr:zinc ribbon domain-containing protein [Paenibacillus koleovorans]